LTTEKEKSSIEQSAEIALSTVQTLSNDKKDLEIRLNEALKLLDKERIKSANLEVELGEAKKAKNTLDAMEDLKISYDEIKQAYDELLEVERLRTASRDFQSANLSKTTIPPRPWISAVDAINFYTELNKASIYAIEHNDPWRKILFDMTNMGRLKAARLDDNNSNDRDDLP
jgi:hypothetical protein